MAIVTAKVKVLDNDICSKCRLIKVTNFPKELWGDNFVVAVENHYQCDNLNQCMYLRDLFQSASETPPKVEDEVNDS